MNCSCQPGENWIDTCGAHAQQSRRELKTIAEHLSGLVSAVDQLRCGALIEGEELKRLREMGAPIHRLREYLNAMTAG